LQLQSEATQAALRDAGLTIADIDGIITTPIRVENWSMPCAVVADHLGIRPSFLSTADIAGASGCAMIHQAAMAVGAGQAKTVLCVAGQNLLSAPEKRASAAGHAQFEAPYGPLTPSLYALVAARHMHEFGTTPEQMAEVAVAIRGHAHLNPNAYKQALITVDDVLNSRVITTPLHMLDCSIPSDGACAAIVTSNERAKDLQQQPVRLLGQGYGFSNAHVGDYKTVTTSGAVQSGQDAYRTSGLGPADIDVAELYDCFTITVLVELEDLGFCPKGEGGRFVEGGRIRLGGELPITTHGGLLSGGHPGLPGGFFHVIEGVRQLRGELGPRQVKDAQVAMVHGNGGVIGIHCTLILGAAAAA
jgi:acetyl-CoA acetyltransferase